MVAKDVSNQIRRIHGDRIIGVEDCPMRSRVGLPTRSLLRITMRARSRYQGDTILIRRIDPSSHFLLALHTCLVVSVCSVATADDEKKLPRFGIDDRTPWQNLYLTGSPEPPLPYDTEQVFEEIEFDRPIYAKSEPGTNNLLVIQQGGEKDRPTRILRLDTAAGTPPEELLKLDGRIAYGLEFDPNYEANGHLYLFTNGPTPEPERKNRISRFHVNRTDNADCDATSELTILQWRSMGHDGGELGFGADGMMYISSGDGTTDSDVWLSAQDVSNLLGGVLRIDVRNATAAAPYEIPPDNPLIGMENARGEIWAFGLRNPWRLWCDPASGQVWVGNNGQDLWESIHLIRRGENYGWSVYEGSHPFYPQRQRGPAVITPPTMEHHHTEARSLTGGVVYRGSRLPDLEGAYIYGDYATGKIWGIRHDGEQVTWHQELADTVHQIAGFAITPDDDLIVVDHGGGLHRLVPSPPTDDTPDFPKLLSETGLFDSVEEHKLNAGVIPYSVNAPGWNDHATADRFLAIPGDQKISVSGNASWNLPNGSVVIQTLSMAGDGDPVRIETRLMVRQQNEWAGYSYRWNETQTDADLVAKSGVDLQLPGPTGESIDWHIPSRSECLSCHSRAANFVLGLNNRQMHRKHTYGKVEAKQLATLHHIGLLDSAPDPDVEVLSNPYDTTLSLQSRARSYLDVNCACCHINAGGGNARMLLEFDRELEKMELVSARPQHASFQIGNAMIVAPGQPDRSVLLTRISRRGAGQMPPLSSRNVDQSGVDLLRNWIASLPRNERKFVNAWTTEQVTGQLDQLNEARSIANGKKIYQELGCIQCHRIAEEGGGAGPDLTDIAKKSTPSQIIESIIQPSAKIAPEYAMTKLMTIDGRMLIGRIESEDKKLLRLRSPESFDTPITIKTSDIEQRGVSKTSMMPADMLNSCSMEEILDLIAYLNSVSDQQKAAETKVEASDE